MAFDAFGTKYRLWQLFLAWGLPFGFLIYAYVSRTSEIKEWVYFANMGLLTGYFLLTVLRNYWKKLKYPVYAALISIILIGELAGNCTLGVKSNSGDTRKRHIKDQTSYQKLVTDDGSFYRSEIDRQWMRNVTMYSGGNGLVMFNSTMYSTVVSFGGTSIIIIVGVMLETLELIEAHMQVRKHQGFLTKDRREF